MTTSTAIGMVVAAGLLGVTHGIEPDHVAGIAALTDGADDSRLAAVVGGIFAAGHVLLVLVWIAVAIVLLGVTTFPPVLETAGLTLVGVVLVGLSAVLGGRAGWKLIHRHEHDHDEGPHAHFHLHLHLHLPGRAHRSPAPHDHEHGLREYVRVGVVGALFTLSPPLSMIVFVSVVLANAPVVLAVPVVVAYAVAITLTMSGVGYASGAVFRLTRRHGAWAHATLELAVAGVVLLVALRLLSETVPVLLAV